MAAPSDEMRRIPARPPGTRTSRPPTRRRQAELTCWQACLAGSRRSLNGWRSGRPQPAASRAGRVAIACRQPRRGGTRRVGLPAEVTAQMVPELCQAARRSISCQEHRRRPAHLRARHRPPDRIAWAGNEDRQRQDGMMGGRAWHDALCLGEMGIGNTTAAATLAAALFGGSAAPTGRDRAPAGRRPALANNKDRRDRRGARPSCEDDRRLRRPLTLCWPRSAERSGHHRRGATPTWAASRCCSIGYACTAAAVLHAVDRRALDYCLVAHRSAEPATRAPAGSDRQAIPRSSTCVSARPSGAALAVPLLKTRRSPAMTAWRRSLKRRELRRRLTRSERVAQASSGMAMAADRRATLRLRMNRRTLIAALPFWPLLVTGGDGTS